ncbi:PAS domain S-box protein [Sphingomonas sp. BN140010]|uniref:histidine kinase n=1 Tax=Sphingomonas arvum TaxID=2992113 RepID=A0ABT3JAY8_9SPHN|nr:PAS domain S-box protein [Sphingomonas sp. BN140010]MCW3796235.1 PAS domain S-box protein [Sphingomonas sp. BN140010]
MPNANAKALVLAPGGRDAAVAAGILAETGITAEVCRDLSQLVALLNDDTGFALVTEEALRGADLRPLDAWLDRQPEWSDFPFILLTVRGGGLERNPAATRYIETLGNVTFLERPFHPTTLVSLARAALRGRGRQYEARARLADLRENEARYRQIVEGAEDFAIMRVDAAGLVESWNTGAERITGWSAEEVIGRSGDMIFTPEDRAVGIPDHELNRAYEDGRSINERWHLKKDGSRFWGSGLTMRLDQEGGGYLKIFRDRTTEHQGEAALRESEEHYRFAAELNPQVPWTATPDGQLDRVAERWRDWTGTTGLGDSWAQGLHPEDAGFTAEAWAHSIATGDPYDVKHRIKMRDGTFRWAHTRAFPRFDDEGRVVKWYGSTENIHEQRLAEDRLRELNDTLEARVAERTAELAHAQDALRQSQKMEAMGTLTGGVAHDFNNLLTPIVGSLDLLQRRNIGSEREQRLIEGALQSAERAKTLVQRLLAFARKQPLQARAVDLATLIRDMGDLVSRTSGPRVEVALDLAPDLPAVLADPNQLEMAILNLAVNARDAMPDSGTLTLSATPVEIGEDHEELLPGRYVHLVVADTGVGMDEHTLARAVEPFFSTKGIGRGTGLGLSMVHGLAAQLGGALVISSKPSRGTRVEVWLPTAAHAQQPETVEKVPSGELRRGVILLVDDESLVRESTADMLLELGFAVVEAPSALGGLQLVKDGLAPDLLITDHLMPGMTGVELARAIRNIRPRTPVLVISGYAELDGIAVELPRLTKPFRQAELASKIAEVQDAA